MAKEKWDRYEAALLVELYIKTKNLSDELRLPYLRKFSAKLKKRAELTGKTPNKSFRSLSEVARRYDAVKALFEGKKMSKASRLEKEAHRLYIEDAQAFRRLLADALTQIGGPPQIQYIPLPGTFSAKVEHEETPEEISRQGSFSRWLLTEGLSEEDSKKFVTAIRQNHGFSSNTGELTNQETEAINQALAINAKFSGPEEVASQKLDEAYQWYRKFLASNASESYAEQREEAMPLAAGDEMLAHDAFTFKGAPIIEQPVIEEEARLAPWPEEDAVDQEQAAYETTEAAFDAAFETSQQAASYEGASSQHPFIRSGRQEEGETGNCPGNLDACPYYQSEIYENRWAHPENFFKEQFIALESAEYRYKQAYITDIDFDDLDEMMRRQREDSEAIRVIREWKDRLYAFQEEMIATGILGNAGERYHEILAVEEIKRSVLRLSGPLAYPGEEEAEQAPDAREPEDMKDAYAADLQPLSQEAPVLAWQGADAGAAAEEGDWKEEAAKEGALADVALNAQSAEDIDLDAQSAEAIALETDNALDIDIDAQGADELSFVAASQTAIESGQAFAGREAYEAMPAASEGMQVEEESEWNEAGELALPRKALDAQVAAEILAASEEGGDLSGRGDGTLDLRMDFALPVGTAQAIEAAADIIKMPPENPENSRDAQPISEGGEAEAEEEGYELELVLDSEGPLIPVTANGLAEIENAVQLAVEEAAPYPGESAGDEPRNALA